MITIKNTQRKIKINTAQLKRDAQIILDALGYSDFDLGIWLTTNATIRKYNRDYRKKDKATDILSFPFYPDLKPGDKIILRQAPVFAKQSTPRLRRPGASPGTQDERGWNDEKNLGDLIISLQYVKADARKLGISFNDRTKRLLVHGICHLLGYDHMNDKDYQLMLKKERELAKMIGLEINE